MLSHPQVWEPRLREARGLVAEIGPQAFHRQATHFATALRPMFEIPMVPPCYRRYNHIQTCLGIKKLYLCSSKTFFYLEIIVDSQKVGRNKQRDPAYPLSSFL